MNIKLNSTKIILISLLLSTCLACQKEKLVDITQKINLEKVIDSEFKFYQMPGLACVAVKGDSLVFSGARGYANLHKEKPFTVQTRMLIASVSKTMAVTAIMQLYEKGLLWLDDDINNYLPFKVKNPNYPQDTITVKMLLTHTSSISDDGYLSSLFYLFGYVDYPESLMSFEKNYLTSEGKYYTKESFSQKRPGAQYSYSNVGAALLACLVEYISGTDYNTYCKTNIFGPLGMTSSTWFFEETPEEEIAIPYTDNNIVNPKNPFYSYPTYPDGHLITTAEDLSKFLRAYIMDGTFNNYQLLSPESIDLILHNYTKSDFIGPQGLIFFEEKMGADSVWGHDGGDPGVSTEMYFSRKNKTGYIMFNNRTDAYSEILGTALLMYAKQ